MLAKLGLLKLISTSHDIAFSAPRLETSIIFIDGKAVASGGKTIFGDVGDGIDGSAK